MKIRIFDDKASLGRAAAQQAAGAIQRAISEHGRARVVAATGVSQFAFLEALIEAPAIDWRKVELFHLDEYIGLPITHPASFRKFLLERLVNKTGITNFHALDGEAANPAQVARRIGQELNAAPVDVAFVGIGENGHLAFNDPHVADFHDPHLVKVMEPDPACRQQQVHEGAFSAVEEMPRQGLTLTIPALTSGRELICTVPGARKAAAVGDTLRGEISPRCPASILRRHPHCTLFLDAASAGLLGPA